jgi:hypothetical protein
MKPIRVVSIVLLCLALLLAPANCGKGDKTAPSAVTNLMCTSPCSDKTPTFSWDAATDNSSGVDHYSVCMWGWGAAATERVWVNVGDATDYTLDDQLPDGQHTFEVKAVDKAGNEGPSLLCGIVCDSTAPIISDFFVAIHGLGCEISWTTNENVDCEVEYGTTTAYGTSQPASGLVALLPPHHYTVDLTGLTDHTTYHYRVKATDLCGNEAMSDDYTFCTFS